MSGLFFFGRYASHPCPAAYPLFVKYIIFFFLFFNLVSLKEIIIWGYHGLMI
jgi:hypothetical protein